MRRPLGLALCLLATGASHAAGARPCAPAQAAVRDVAAALAGLFAALRTDDVNAFREVITPDFYAYDAGEPFSGDGLLKRVKQAHASGKKFEWSVTDPKVHVSCDSALITYVNRGWVEDTSGRQDVTWLESATLQYDGKHWLIRFFHSSRASKPVSP